MVCKVEVKTTGISFANVTAMRRASVVLQTDRNAICRTEVACNRVYHSLKPMLMTSQPVTVVSKQHIRL
ncbi:hypothetical protein HaLaN_03456 [Haematococcus lacustris]|uniref:Uncharacterized protein n=1 Tax=Haematococcus lacustris TaxID=44745 RepID=A0A699YNW1_HAELA|nr:hypothetical protein HaLaN_03456 [Haematococcus lacustris]